MEAEARHMCDIGGRQDEPSNAHCDDNMLSARLILLPAHGESGFTFR
jgi:hypothetical protein